MTKISFSCLTTLGALSLASSLSAAPSFYAGLQGGYSHGDLKIDAHHYYGAGLNPYDTTIKTTTKNSFQAGFIGGGDYAISSKIALGLQLIGDFNPAETTTAWKHGGFIIPLQISIRKPFTLTPALTCAYLINSNWCAFLSLGLSISKFRVRTYNTDDHIAKKATSTKVGFAPSLGVEYHASPRWSVVGLLGLEHYKGVKFKQSMFDDPAAPYEALSLKIKSRYINGRIGVLFRFGTH